MEDTLEMPVKEKQPKRVRVQTQKYQINIYSDRSGKLLRSLPTKFDSQAAAHEWIFDTEEDITPGNDECWQVDEVKE